MYIVAGVTGNTGSAVAQTLLDRGEEVTVLVRSQEKGERWAAKGANVAVGDLEDAGALTKILKQARGAYLLFPPNYVPNFLEAKRKLAETYARAVADSGIEHLVFLSSVGGQHDSGTGLILSNHAGEVALRRSARNVTFLRPPYYFENWVPAVIPVPELPMPVTATNDGVLSTFLTADRKIPMIATRDIGRIAAEALLDPSKGVRTLELTGPEEYSPNDLASILSALIGREVRVEQAPLEAARPAFEGLGMPEDVAQGYEELIAAINSGRADYERKGTEFRHGTTGAREFFSAALRGEAGIAA
jgi:uncharacterized protein YbjT (DUF2867 family)